MKPDLRLSVVIPVKDDAENLERCLQALASQRGRILEVIVVDNGSSDDSASVAETYGATLIHEHRPGIAAAASAGYDAASGDLISRLDADSLPHEDWAASVIEFFDRHPDTAALTGGATFTDGARAFRKSGAALYLGAYYLLVSTALAHVPLFGSNFAMRRDTWRAASDEVHRHDLLVHDDMDVSFHLGPRKRIRFAPRVRVGISSRPFSDGRRALRVRRGFHTIVLHWPHDLPWLRLWRRVRGRTISPESAHTP